MDSHSPRTLQEAIVFFSNYANCHQAVAAIRWPDGVVKCPTCGADKVTYLKNARVWKCYGKHPRAKFSLKVGTIFEDSPIPLKSWLLAVWMITNCRNGISSYELARAIGVTQKTAWFMNHRIRLAMQGDGGGTLDGEVEVDETYIGGKARNMHPRKKRALGTKNRGGMRGGGFPGKVAVMGLLQRSTDDKRSRVRTTVVPNVRKHHLHAEVAKNVPDGTTVYTDALMSYRDLGLYYQHKVIDHAEKYVDGQIHTNGLENYWSLLKRTIGGTYVSVEPFHLFRYLDEQAFRFNERRSNDASRFTATLTHITGRRLTWSELMGAKEELR